MLSSTPGPIGIFDSGYGGLTILKEIRRQLPGYDYIYLGDNARAPYGSRSYYVIYNYTLQAVKWLFSQGCHLIVLACNTASAKALRTIQQNDLPEIDCSRRVLGVIRPSAESIGNLTKTKRIGVLGTPGTVNSESYPLEIKKIFPDIEVFQQACPLWVPLIENNEYNNPGARYFIEKDVKALLEKGPGIDTIILGCTHYPLIYDIIKACIPAGINLISQDTIVAGSLADYLGRHSEIDSKCTRNGKVLYFTTDVADTFTGTGKIFLGKDFPAEHVTI